MRSKRVTILISMLVFFAAIGVIYELTVKSPVVMPEFQSSAPSATLLPIRDEGIEPTIEIEYPTPPNADSTSLQITHQVFQCPDSPLVPIENLDLPQNLGLLLQSESASDDIGTYVAEISGESLQLELLDVPAGFVSLEEVVISPDGQWLALTYDATNENLSGLFISSSDGSRQWMATELEETYYAQWVTNHELAIFGPEDPDNLSRLYGSIEVRPLFILNPFKYQVIDLPQLPEKPQNMSYDRQYHGVFAQDDEYFVVYLDSADGFEYFVYNYSLNTAMRILTWLRDPSIGTVPFGQRKVEIQNGEFIVSIARYDGTVEISRALDFEEVLAIQNYDDVMKKIELPVNFLPLIVTHFSSSGLIAQPWTEPTDFITPPPLHLYNIDFANLEIIDYCLDQLFIDTRINTIVSLDERFMAMTFSDEASPDLIEHSVVILDLESGYFSRIEDYRFINWLLIP